MAVGVGDPAPEIALPDHEGRVWRLSEQMGRPVVLVFHRHLA
jgi:peroxiredoxin